MKKFIKDFLELFLAIYFGISLAFAICGLLVGKEHTLSYTYVFYPMGLAFLCTFPAMLASEPEKLTAKQHLFRRILQIVLLEGIVLPTVYFYPLAPGSVRNVILVGFIVILVYLLVFLIGWIFGYLEAEELNRGLREMKK